MEQYLPIFDSLRLSCSDTLTLLRDEVEFCKLLGTYYVSKGKYDVANQYFRRGIQGLRSLRIEIKLKNLDSQYATLLCQAASSMKDQWKDESGQMCREGVRILEELYQGKPHLYEARLGYSYKCLGSVYKNLGRVEEGEIALLEAERYYRKSVRRNSRANSRFLGHCMYELGELYLENKDYNRALQCLENSQEIYLGEIEGRIRYADDLSEINYDIGKCSYHLGDYKRALECNLISLADLEPYYKSDPEVYREKMGNRLLHLCNVYVRLRDYKKAEFYITRGAEVDPENVKIQRQLMEVKKLLILNP